MRVEYRVIFFPSCFKVEAKTPFAPLLRMKKEVEEERERKREREQERERETQRQTDRQTHTEF